MFSSKKLIDPWTVYSVWRRHLTVYQATWVFNFLPPITEPLFYLFGFGLGLSPMVGKIVYHDVSLDYLKFIAPGMIGVAALLQGFFEAAYGGFIRLHYQHTWQALLTAPVTYTDLFLGELCWAATRGSIAGLITSLVIILTGFAKFSDLLLFLPLTILGSFLFAALGLLTVGIIEKIDQINIPVFLLVVPMSVMAGTYYPRSNLPDTIEQVVSFLPLSALVDILRYNLVPHAAWLSELFILFIWTLLFVVTAWFSIRQKLFK
jgi:lipooligosaccharide transport system permease protein